MQALIIYKVNYQFKLNTSHVQFKVFLDCVAIRCSLPNIDYNMYNLYVSEKCT